MPSTYFVVALLLAGCYAAILRRYRHGWCALPEWKMPAGFAPTVGVSILIPARNEAHNIGPCLHSILDNNYPPNLLEILVVDDHSTDETAAVVCQIQAALAQKGHPSLLRLLNLAEYGVSGKKMALTQAVRQATMPLVLTTDADCVVGREWIRGWAAAFGLTPGGLGAGPVLFQPSSSLLQQFQALDFIGLMGITGAGIHLGFQRMGNGANMAYRKAVFEAVNGYAGNENIASGDDLFLIQKVEKQFPGSVFFLKSRETAVWTAAEPNWRAFWRQRVRWGAKNAALPEWPVRLVLLAVFLFCWSIVLNGCWLVWALFFFPQFHYGLFGVLLGQIAVKVWADWLFLREVCRFFDRTALLRQFWPSFVLHTVYIAVVGLAGLFYKEYEWKGRRTR